MKILVIDHSGESITVCKRIFSQAFSVVPAGTLEEGFEAAVREAPDMILLDMDENQKESFELCRKLTRGKVTSKIPVVILSVSNDEESVKAARELGVVDFIPKPIIPTLLYKHILTVMERYAGRIKRCSSCLQTMQADWSYCPFDGTRLHPVDPE